MLILLGFIIGLPLLGQWLHRDLNLLPRLLLPPLNFLYNAIVTVTGSGGTFDTLGLNSDTLNSMTASDDSFEEDAARAGSPGRCAAARPRRL